MQNLSFAEHDNLLAQSQRNLNATPATFDDLGVGEESESEDLLGLDPKEWKVCVPKSHIEHILPSSVLLHFYASCPDH